MARAPGGRLRRRGVLASLLVLALGCAGAAWVVNARDTREAATAQTRLQTQLRELWTAPVATESGANAAASGPARSGPRKAPVAVAKATAPIPTPAPSATPQGSPGLASEGSGEPGPEPGIPLALMRIPRLGPGWVYAVVEGSTDNAATLAALREGPTHLAGTHGPGQVGNFAVAAHRWGAWGWFYNLPDLRTGDPVIVETARAVYTYRVTGSETVAPSNTSAIGPDPAHPDRRASKATITLTTCTPLYISTHRLAVHGELVSTTAKT